jgi:hypothetical protein
MNATLARKDGTKKKAQKGLSDEQVGVLQRRLADIIRRVEEGELSYEVAAQALQRISEKTFISHYPQTKAKEAWEIFKRAPPEERRKSLSPYGMTLAHQAKRLEYPDRTPEHVMMELWESENIPKTWINHNRVPLNTILNAIEVLPHDAQVVAATVQWFGCNIGLTYLGQFIRAAELRGYI